MCLLYQVAAHPSLQQEIHSSWFFSRPLSFPKHLCLGVATCCNLSRWLHSLAAGCRNDTVMNGKQSILRVKKLRSSSCFFRKGDVVAVDNASHRLRGGVSCARVSASLSNNKFTFNSQFYPCANALGKASMSSDVERQVQLHLPNESSSLIPRPRSQTGIILLSGSALSLALVETCLGYIQRKHPTWHTSFVVYVFSIRCCVPCSCLLFLKVLECLVHC